MVVEPALDRFWVELDLEAEASDLPCGSHGLGGLRCPERPATGCTLRRDPKLLRERRRVRQGRVNVRLGCSELPRRRRFRWTAPKRRLAGGPGRGPGRGPGVRAVPRAVLANRESRRGRAGRGRDRRCALGRPQLAAIPAVPPATPRRAAGTPRPRDP